MGKNQEPEPEPLEKKSQEPEPEPVKICRIPSPDNDPCTTLAKGVDQGLPPRYLVLLVDDVDLLGSSLNGVLLQHIYQIIQASKTVFHPLFNDYKDKHHILYNLKK